MEKVKSIKKIIMDELNLKNLERIAEKITSIRSDYSSLNVKTKDLYRKDRETFYDLLMEYQHGYFDGMTDCYIFEGSNKERSFKFVFLNNEFSENTILKVKSDLREKYNVIDDQSSQKVFGNWFDTIVHKKCCEL